MGIGWTDALDEINLNLQRDLMERNSLEKFWKGKGMTFCQRRKGTRRAGDRAGDVIGSREVRSGI
jgi:hypothetical protein